MVGSAMVGSGAESHGEWNGTDTARNRASRISDFSAARAPGGPQSTTLRPSRSPTVTPGLSAQATTLPATDSDHSPVLVRLTPNS